MEKLSYKKLVAENEISWFYTTWFSSEATKYAHSKELKGLVVLLVESKEDTSQSYVVIDQKAESYVYDNTNYEAVLYWIDAAAFSRSFEKKKRKPSLHGKRH